MATASPEMKAVVKVFEEAKTSADISSKFMNSESEPGLICQYKYSLGAGFDGLLYAVRMVQAGIRPENIRIVDTAGGFGGTWYYNRYPCIACDIESYCYLPLLEEMGYMPKHKYSSGAEIRNYANQVVARFGVDKSAVFQTKAKKLVWDDAAKEWEVELVQKRDGQEPQTLNIRAQFVAAVNGILNWPKLQGFPGIGEFEGEIFHSSPWNYDITGGTEEDPSLDKLKDKRVAIIGTGPTAFQAIPYLGKWAKHLYVVQRTPASVDVRNQKETDPQWFHKEVVTGPDWQRERMKNFNMYLTTGRQPGKNLVNDGWTHAVSMVAITGNPAGPDSMEEFQEYMKTLNAIRHSSRLS